MQNHIARSGVVLLLVAASGCCLGPTVDTVPWWKGIPCMVIAPSSLEAMAWRDHLHARRQAACVRTAPTAPDWQLEPLPMDFPAAADASGELPSEIIDLPAIPGGEPAPIGGLPELAEP